MAPKQRASSVEQLQVSAQTLTYTLIFAKRKSIGITVRPDMSVTVRAPQGISRQAVAEVVQARGPWILRNLQKFSQRRANQTQQSYREGGTYPFLGRNLLIRLDGSEEAHAKAEKVELHKDVLYLKVKESDNEMVIASFLAAWSRMQAESYFLDRMTSLFHDFNEFRLQLPMLKIRSMRARWGSCSNKGLVTLNLKLIHLDPSLIDYVIMHELCHLVEHNHSKRFYALLTRMMPDWSERRQRLGETWMP